MKRRQLLCRLTKTLIGGALCCALTLVAIPNSAYATSSEDLQAELDKAEAQLEEYNRTAAQAGAELDKASYDLDQTRQQIEDVQAQIEVQEANLAQAQSYLSVMLSNQYKAGPTTMLDLIFGASNFDELISHLVYANKISESFQDSIGEVRELRSALENSKAELDEKEDLQEQQVAVLQEKKSTSEQAEAEAEQYISELSSELREALASEQAAREEASRKEAERLASQQQTITDSPINENTTSENIDNSTMSNTSTDSSGSSLGETAVYWAKTQLGKPYGHDNDGTNWDCNGLTHWAWAQAGYSIPASSGHYGYGQFQYMKNSGRWVTSISHLKPGDLVFYSYDGGITTYHVAMYIGNYQVIHSNGWGSGVVITGIYFDSGFCGGGTP